MLTQGDDVEAHATRRARLVDLSHRPPSRARPQDGPLTSPNVEPNIRIKPTEEPGGSIVGHH